MQANLTRGLEELRREKDALTAEILQVLGIRCGLFLLAMYCVALFVVFFLLLFSSTRHFVSCAELHRPSLDITVLYCTVLYINF